MNPPFSTDQLSVMSDINDLIIDSGLAPIRFNDFVDWEISGNESYDKIKEMASDYINECYTDINEDRNSWRYQL